MSPLIWDDEVVRFEPKSDPGQWIDLKKELSSGDDDAIWEAVVTATIDSAEDLRLGFRVTVLNRERVRRSIVAWSYTRNGVPVEVTPENIDRLDRRTYAELVAEVDRLNPFQVPRMPSTKPSSSPTSAALRVKSRQM
jgi:hypothetical protein